MPGLISGVGAMGLVIAALNSHGPGTYCVRTASGGESCTDEWSPVPFLIAGVLLMSCGALLFARRRRSWVSARS